MGLTYIFDLIRIIGDAEIVLQITHKMVGIILIQSGCAEKLVPEESGFVR